MPDSTKRIAPSLAVALCAAIGAAQGVDVGGLYSLPRSQDDLAELQRARQELGEGRYGAAVERLHGLVEDGSPGVVPTPVGIDRFEGVRHAAVRELAGLTGEARSTYERLVRRQAGHLLDRPLPELGTEQLEHLAHEYPVADVGIRARIRLGDLALERGDGLAAQRHYRAAADAVADLPGLGVRRATARALATGRAAPGDPIAGRAAAMRPRATPGRWPAYGGGEDGTRAMMPPIGRSIPIANDQIVAQGFLDHPYRPTPFPMHAVGDLDGLFVSDGESVWALDALGLEVGPRWRAAGPMTELSPLEFEEVAEAINPDTVLSCAIDDELVIAPLLVPNDVVGASETQTFKGSINIIRKISSRRLFAFDRQNGKLLWSHWDRKDGPVSHRFDGHDACGPPLIAGDTVYVPTHDQTGAIAYYLSAYDLHDGEPRWRRLICSSGQEVNMFGNARQEFAAAPLAIDEGVVYGTTNLGTCFAVDAADGAIRWVAGYETIPLPRTQLRDQQPRPVFFANNPAVVHQGVLACTPLDSEYAVGLDIETGRMLWRVHHEYRRPEVSIRWLLGALGDEFVFAGLGVLAVEAKPEHGPALRARTRIVASAEQLGEDSAYRIHAVPRGALTEDRIWLIGSNGRLHVLDRDGHVDARRNDLPIRDLGNLLLADGIAAVCRVGSLTIHADLGRLEFEAEREVRRTPDDPRAHLRLARIVLATTSAVREPAGLARAIEVYDRGLRAAHEAGLGEGSPVFRQLADGHFDLTLRRARATARTDLEQGLRLLRACRDAAARPEQWITAQLEITDAVHGSRLVEELDRMRDRFGEQEFRFPDAGRIPIAAYCLWRSIPEVPPAEAIARCHELMRRFGEVRLESTTARELARARIRRLIELHGREPYAAIEREAEAALASAGDDRRALDEVARVFPHSLAAARATGKLIDLAVRAGDLTTAARAYADTGSPPPGTMRRMMVAAGTAGNDVLAHEIGGRLAARHGSERSDYPPDGGRTFVELARELEPVPEPAPEHPAPPRELLGLLTSPNIGTPLEFAELRVVPGYRRAAPAPLFVTVDGRELRAFPAAPLPERLADAAYTLPIRELELHDLLLCGGTLVACEHSRIRGADAATGKVLWTLDAPARRQLTSLGAHAGLVLVYSAALTGGDGGVVLGIEPLSGVALYERVLDPSRSSFVPVRAEHGIWYWETRPRPAIVGLDPLTGVDRTRIELPGAALDFLGLTGENAFRIQNYDLQTRFFADDAKVVIPSDVDSERSSPRCIALAHDGRVLWRWTGQRGQTLAMVAPHGERTVILASGASSQLVVLDEFGQALRTRELGAQARIHNWSGGGGPDPAPDVLVLSDDPLSPRLTCMSIVARKPHFQTSLDRAVAILPQPIVGADFLAIPVRTRSPDRHNRAVVLCIDLEQPLTSTPADVPIDGGRSFPLPLELRVQGRLSIIECPDGLFFVGDARSSSK